MGEEQARIIIDTREQEPYTFESESVRRKLDAGDYSIEGHETTVAVERKSLADFVNTVIHSRKRFHKELEKLTGYKRACIVVEASMRDVLEGTYGTGAHPSAVIGAVISLCVDWNVPVYFCGDRQCAREFVERYLERMKVWR